jgi:DNA-binding transcriptional regulator YdaS (Cro superfamily)
MPAMKTQAAIQYFGNASRLADALGIRRSAVSQWGDDVPPLRAYQIRDLMNSTVAEKLGAGETAHQPIKEAT